ncbi:MAG: hypothetical protein IPJ82_20015 [Lewinellaceae bacterium]|nr:hypothetical protein [Lewinellaceae bacterium]
MRETISSNCLFHFTNNATNLVGILINGFKPRYCLEDFFTFKYTSGGGAFEMAVPMVCFCDIPLSKIKGHLSDYGGFGIGLTKEWGIKNGVTPILYVNQDSETTKYIRADLITMANNPEKSTNPQLHENFLGLLRFIRFTKPYEGKFWRNGGYMKDEKGVEKMVRFYDEREWRYVPDIKPLPMKMLLGHG